MTMPGYGAPVIDGADLLDQVRGFLARYIVYPRVETQIAHTLWIAHTHLMRHWDTTPRIAFLSPEPGSGKSRALEVTETLVPRPVHSVNATPAYLFRKVSDPDGLPTLLYDEIDTLFGPRAKDNEEVRGMLNAGYRTGATAGRCVIRGKIIETEELPAYCAVAIAGLNDVPDTVSSRSIIVRMRRRAPGEYVQPWRNRTCSPAGHEIRDELEQWAASIEAITWPELPECIQDRDAEIWEALLVVADLAGGSWPELARRTAVTLVTATGDRAPSLGVMLLGDLRTVFTTAGADKLATETIIEKLIAMDESPWGDLHDKPIDARGLARRLRKYGIKPRPCRVGDDVFKGYDRADLADAWSRYLPARPSPDSSVTAVTAVTDPADSTGGRNRVTDVTDTATPTGDRDPDVPDWIQSVVDGEAS